MKGSSIVRNITKHKDDMTKSETDEDYSMTQTRNQRKRENSQSPDTDVIKSKKKTFKICETPSRAISDLDVSFTEFFEEMEDREESQNRIENCPTSKNCELN